MEESKTKKRIGYIIKATLTVALFAFIGALVFRMCQASYKAIEDTKISDAFREAYRVSDDVRTHAVNDEFSENGSVYAYSLVYIEEGGYLQLTVRYNVRHIDEVKLTYPELEESDIYYELTDSNGVTYKPNILAVEKKYNYCYFKLEFEGVDFSTDALKLSMILGEIDINVGDKSTLTVHRKSDTYIPYQISSEEQALLSKERK